MPKANYATHPYIDIMLSAGTWTHVEKLFTKISDMYHMITAASNNSNDGAAELHRVKQMIKPKDTTDMCLLDYLDETNRLYEEIKEYTGFDIIPSADNTEPLPDFLQNLINTFMTCATGEKGYFLLVTNPGALPSMQFRFKDRDTLVDFAQHMNLTGEVFKHVETIRITDETAS